MNEVYWIDTFLLKHTCNSSDHSVKFIIDNKWETVPDMRLGWIIKYIDYLYIIRLGYKDEDKDIGFM